MKTLIVIAVVLTLTALSGCDWHASTSSIGSSGAGFASAMNASHAEFASAADSSWR